MKYAVIFITAIEHGGTKPAKHLHPGEGVLPQDYPSFDSLCLLVGFAHQYCSFAGFLQGNLNIKIMAILVLIAQDIDHIRVPRLECANVCMWPLITNYGKSAALTRCQNAISEMVKMLMMVFSSGAFFVLGEASPNLGLRLDAIDVNELLGGEINFSL